ncbi:Drug resistance transporter EmrB/QacA subfamily [[Actinomadura] parvosata subsp. kistnae]|uniref:MFS transporter n=1 Tax=[Actinomadura] parvosata subsp. kistnae TaxID=1909395 RepID=A0A1V0AHK9_9ACTN|nr:MFS transporter [Nonomuraea sp. ATCC 55076]AQZ69697.1 MFS transporter [Nonomuraea sp. ATCC 55076]SPL91590.1 Drug resistance transporter EmrB/QacA subfamily [Actinomadura parvosata subsp. kistnae]
MPATTTPIRDAWRTLSVVSLASVLTGLSGSAINVALPEIARHTGAGATAASWILLGYQLTTTVLMVVFGRLADMFGRRRMYLLGLATYTLAALLAGLAPNAWVIVLMRVLQAMGGAMLLTNSAALISDAFPRERLGEGMGVYVASFSIAGLIGPTLGGVLAESLGWRWVFWFNVPVGVACLLLGLLVLPRPPRNERRGGLDGPGNVLVLTTLGGLLLALSEFTRLGWDHPVVLGGLAAFVAGLPLFLLRESRAAHPVVDLSLFRERAFAFGTLASFLNAVARMGMVFLVALYFQAVRGDEPVQAGLKVLPLAVAAMIGSVSSGFLQRLMSARTLAVAGAATTTCGLVVMLSVMSADMPYPAVAAGLVLIGLGSGAFLPSNTTAILDGLPSNRLGIVNAMRLMLQNTGNVVGTGLVLSIITAPLPAELHQSVFAGTLAQLSGGAVEQLVTGYRWAFSAMAAISVLTVLSCLARRKVS